MSPPEFQTLRRSTSSNKTATMNSNDPTFKVTDRRPKLRRAIATWDIIHPAQEIAVQSRSTTPPPSSATGMAGPPTNKQNALAKVTDMHVGHWVKGKWTHPAVEERRAREWAKVNGEQQVTGKDAAGHDVYVDQPSRLNPYAYNEIGSGGIYPAYRSVPGFIFSGLLLAGFW